MEDESYTGVVTDICGSNSRRYAVVKVENHEAKVTFSFKVWSETDLPRKGTHVFLSNLIKTKAGWRSQSARKLRLSDEKGK